MKKILKVALCVCLMFVTAFTFVGCDNKEDENAQKLEAFKTELLQKQNELTIQQDIMASFLPSIIATDLGNYRNGFKNMKVRLEMVERGIEAEYSYFRDERFGKDVFFGEDQDHAVLNVGFVGSNIVEWFDDSDNYHEYSGRDISHYGIIEDLLGEILNMNYVSYSIVNNNYVIVLHRDATSNTYDIDNDATITVNRNGQLLNVELVNTLVSGSEPEAGGILGAAGTITMEIAYGEANVEDARALLTAMNAYKASL